MAYQRGDIVLVPFPFTDLSTTKVRPAVVLSSALYHRREPDIVLGAITSKITSATGPLDYVLSDWQAAGLHFPSAFKSVFVTLDPSRVLHHVGTLTATDLREVSRRVRQALGL